MVRVHPFWEGSGWDSLGHRLESLSKVVGRQPYVMVPLGDIGYLFAQRPVVRKQCFVSVLCGSFEEFFGEWLWNYGDVAYVFLVVLGLYV